MTAANKFNKITKSPLILIPLFVVLAAVSYLMFNPSSAFQVLSSWDGATFFEAKGFYSGKFAIAQIHAFGDSGRGLYLSYLANDALYIVCNAAFFSLAIWHLARYLFPKWTKIHWLFLIPLLSGAFDAGEDLCVLMLLKSYPDMSLSTANLLSIFSASKILFGMATMFLILLGVVFGGVRGLWNRLRARSAGNGG